MFKKLIIGEICLIEVVLVTKGKKNKSSIKKICFERCRPISKKLRFCSVSHEQFVFRFGKFKLKLKKKCVMSLIMYREKLYVITLGFSL